MRDLGTSSIVVAAFVGPGTVLTCASAGVGFGYELAWVLVLATVAVFVLQTFTAGCGILAGKGMGEAILDASRDRWYRVPLLVMVFMGLWLGAAAFEAGNLLGAAAGMSQLVDIPGGERLWSAVAAVVALLILGGRLSFIRRALTILVIVMSVCFFSAALLSHQNLRAFVHGLFVPSIPEGSLLTMLALVGTTIVTYNLFLHASVTRRYWAGGPALTNWRRELRGMAIFIPLGGLVSLAILATGAPHTGTVESTGDISQFAALLTPVAGAASGTVFGVGLLSAGLTSAITAPMAVAEGIGELLGWAKEEHSARYRLLWLSVLAFGLCCSLTGLSPFSLIVAAQAANGLLLPLIAGLVVAVVTRQKKLPYRRLLFTAGVAIVGFCAVLGIRTLVWVWSQIS